MSAVDNDTVYIPSDVIITNEVSSISIYKGQNIIYSRF